MVFAMVLTVFIYGQESKPLQHQYTMPSFEECMESTKSIYKSFTDDPTVHEVAVQCIAHREADEPTDERSAGTPG